MKNKSRSKKDGSLSSTAMHEGFSFENDDSDAEMLRSDSVVDMEWENYLKRHQESLFAENSVDETCNIVKKQPTQPKLMPKQIPARPTQPSQPKKSIRNEYSASHRIYNLPRAHKVFERMIDRFDTEAGEVERKEKEGPVSPMSSPDGSPDKEGTSSAHAMSRRLTMGAYDIDGRKQLKEPAAPAAGKEGAPSSATGGVPAPRKPTSASVYSASSKKSTKSSSSRASASSSVDPDVECAQYMLPPEVPKTSADDWVHSSAMQLALNGEDDNFAADLSEVITKVCTPVRRLMIDIIPVMKFNVDSVGAIACG
jgi:hypothetical protein